MNTPIELPPNTVMRYAVPEAQAGAVMQLTGMREHWPPLPVEGAVLNVPFLVCPRTRQPVAVRVVQIQYLLDQQPPTVVIVVGLPS